VLPFSLFSILARVQQNFASAQEVTSIGMKSMVASSLLNLLLLYILFIKLEMGLLGVSLATGSSYFCEFVCNYLLI